MVALLPAAGVPIVPRGAGSGLSGAANAVDGGVTVVMTRMNRILEIDEGNRLAVRSAQVVSTPTCGASSSLFYAPAVLLRLVHHRRQPFGQRRRTVLRRAGPRTPSSDSVVLASGEVLPEDGRSRRCRLRPGQAVRRLEAPRDPRKNSQLWPRAAGTSTIVCRVHPLCRTRAVAGAISAGLVPSLLEIMDATCIKAVEAHTGVSMLGGTETPAAILLGQSDVGATAGMAEMERLEAVCTEAGAVFSYVTADLAEGRMLLQARRDVLPALDVLGTWLTDDVCVPRTAIAALIAECERIGEEVGVLVAVTGHAGDGNMHPTMVYDGSDPDAVARANVAYGRILDAGRALGGTITGEHGVGRMKQSFLAGEIGPVGLSVHRAIKRALDPTGLFNPGSMFSLE